MGNSSLLTASRYRVFVILSAFLMTACVNAPKDADQADRRAKAMSLWQDHCKKSGEFIQKTADGVEGIYLMRLREATNFDDQFKLDDPYGRDSTGDMYLKNFLKGFYYRDGRKYPEGSPPRTGYRYVEAIDPRDGIRYRYTAAVKAVRKKNVNAPAIVMELQKDPSYDINIYDFVLNKTPASNARPRYGVTYDDISTSEDREYWIAGSSLKVIDLQTNEVMAERVGYMVDWAQGSRAGGRLPWIFAADYACPGFQWNPAFPVTRSTGGGATEQPGQTLIFVEKVLKPIN